MTILNSENSIVLIIDIQEKLLNAAFNKEELAKKSKIITQTAKILNLPIIVTEQYPKGLGSTVEYLKEIIKGDSNYFEKTSFSAIENSLIFDEIKKQNKKQIILYGIETHICTSQTANALIEAGFEVNVVVDACGSRFEKEHFAGLERIKANGAKLLTTEIAIFELLRSSKHPNFKEIQALIK